MINTSHAVDEIAYALKKLHGIVVVVWEHGKPGNNGTTGHQRNFLNQESDNYDGIWMCNLKRVDFSDEAKRRE